MYLTKNTKKGAKKISLYPYSCLVKFTRTKKNNVDYNIRIPQEIHKTQFTKP